MTEQDKQHRQNVREYDEVDNLPLVEDVDAYDNMETINTGLPYTEEQEESIIREKNRSVHRRVRKVRLSSEEVELK